MILKLRTLTPLHIGDGSTLHPFDYTVLDGRFYRCSSRFFERFLQKMGGDAPERFVRWSGGIMDDMVNLDQSRRLEPRRGRDFNQTLSDLRRRHTLRGFAKDELKNEQAFLDFLRANAPSVLKQPVGRNEKEKQEYRGFQRGADGRAFLPGSSVKGSIRTALLYHFLETKADHAAVRKILEKCIAEVRIEKKEAAIRKYRYNPSRHLKTFARELEQLAFYAEMKDERGKPRYEEAQDDLMRCLLVADTSVPDEAMGMENVDLYLVKKLPKSMQRGMEMQGQKQTQAPAVEAILPGQQLDVVIDFHLELLLQLHWKAGERGINIGRETHFIGWRERAKTLFDLSEEDFDVVPKDARWNSPTLQPLREKMLAHILSCCRKFSDAQAVKLKSWCDNFAKHARDRYMEDDLENGTEAVLTATGTRLHLGFATGFEGMTVVLYLLAEHKKQFGEIMELFGIGDSPSAWKNRRPGQTYLANPDRFPTSRRLATRQGAIFPLGWLEWADDPKAGAAKTFTQTVVEDKLISPSASVAHRGPVYLLRGSVRNGAELDAELLAGGNPGRFKLFIRVDYTPTVEIRYAAGFKQEDVGRIARLRVKNVKGKEEVTAAEFLKYK